MTHLVVGLYGMMGTGKSLIGTYLSTQGWNYINQDVLGHQVIEEYPHKVIQLIGSDITEHGLINRKLLGSKVFKDSEMLNKLVDFSYPIILDKTKKLLQDGHNIIEGAFFYKMREFIPCTYLWYIFLDEELRQKRLINRGHTSEWIQNISQNQQDIQDHAYLADIVISNNGTPSDLYNQIDDIIFRWQ